MNFLQNIRTIITKITYPFRIITSAFRRIASLLGRAKNYPIVTVFIIAIVLLFLLFIAYSIYILFQGQYLPITICAILLFFLILYFYVRSRRKKRAQNLKLHTQPEKAENVSRDFRGIIRFFRKKKENINSIPLIITIGSENSGKSALINNSKLHFVDSDIITRNSKAQVNWYISTDAVILDIKGRNLFEKNNKVFIKVLKLLSQKRKKLPVNSIILSVSAEDLILREDEKIKEKAIKAFGALEKIKKINRLRAPVYLLITKSDLINGFEEFFTNAPPLERNEILGLDIQTSGKAEKTLANTEDSINSFIDEIYNRRSNLLNNTQLGDTQITSRIYAFPNEMAAVAKKLKNYVKVLVLESKLKIGKPLFLRGVYFTSAAQENNRLSMPIANTSFSKAVSLRRDKKPAPAKSLSLFIYDLFAEKIIKEKDLAIQMANRISFQRVIYVATFSVCILAFAAVFPSFFTAKNELKKKLSKEQPVWMNAAKYESSAPVLMKDSSGKYFFDTEKTIDSLPVSLFNYNLSTLAAKPLNIPRVFIPASLFYNINNFRLKKARQSFESSILNPLFAGLTTKIISKPTKNLNNADEEILLDLLHLRVACLAQAGMFASLSSRKHTIKLDAWFEYVLDNQKNREAWNTYLKSKGASNESIYLETFNNLYKKSDYGWPPNYFCKALSRIHADLEAKEYMRMLYSLQNFENVINKDPQQKVAVNEIQSIPFTSLTDKIIDKNYSIDRLETIINKWKNLDEEYSEARRVVNQKLADKIWEKANSTYRKYLLNYFRYWDTFMSEAEVAVLPWTDYRRDLNNLQPWVINRRLNLFYSTTLESMDKLAAAYDYDKSSVPKEVADRIVRLNNSVKMLKNESINAQLEKFLNYWRPILNSSPLKARDQLFKKDYKKFLASAIFLSKNSRPSFFLDYWRTLGPSFLDSLSKAVKLTVSQQMTEIINNAKFPFSSSASYQKMTKEECSDLVKKLDTLTASVSLYNADELGSLTKDKLSKLGDDLSDRVNNLRPKLLLKHLAWIENAKDLNSILLANKFNFSTQITLLPDLSGNIPEKGSYIWPAIKISQQNNDEKFPLVLTRSQKKSTMGKVICPGGNFEIDFYRNSAELAKNTPHVKGKIPGNWSLLNFLVKGPERPIDYESEFWLSWDQAIYDAKEPDTWITRLVLTSLSGKQFYFYIKLKLPEELSCIQNWTSIENEMK